MFCTTDVLNRWNKKNIVYDHILMLMISLRNFIAVASYSLCVDSCFEFMREFLYVWEKWMETPKI